MAWTLVVDDTFNRANTTPSANPGSVGNGWIDNVGGLYSIQSNKLLGATSDGNGYLNGDQLLRQVSETTLGQRIVANFVWQTYTAATARPSLILRWQDKSNYYTGAISPTSNTLQIAIVVGGANSGTAYNLVSYTLVAGHAYQLDFWCTGSSPTTLQCTVHDLTAGTSVTNNYTDNTSALQTAGRAGVSVNANTNGTTSSINYSEIAVYTGTPYVSQLTLTGPTTGTTGVTSSNFTVTPDGLTTAATVITPSDSSGGGTFSPTTATIASGSSTPVTFTYTPGSTGTKSISITNNQSLTNTGSPITCTVSSPTATSVSLSGPTSGYVGAASTNFTVTPNGLVSANTIITPSDSSGGGTFSPTTATISSGTSTAVTFTYTPGSAGTKSISITNNQSLTNSGTPISYVAAAAATTLTLTGPTSGSVSTASSNFTVTPNAPAAAATIITPSDSSGGGTFSPTTVTIPSGSATPVTFTYTPGSTGTKSISITNNKSLTNSGTPISYVVTAVGMTVSPTTVAANTPGQVVTITGSGTSFSGAPFSLTGGYAKSLQSQTVGSVTSGTVTIDPGIYGHGNLTITDGGSGATANLTVSPRVRGNINLGFIGDEITASDVNNSAGALSTAVVTALNALGYTVTHSATQAHDHASSTLWVPGNASNYYSTAVTAFATAGLTTGDFIHVMLGANDVHPSTSESPTRSALSASQHLANMATIVSGLVSLGFNVILSKPLWTVPYSGTTGQIWPYNCNDTYLAYWQLLMTLVDGVHVFQGDTTAFQYAQANPTTFLGSDGINTAGSASDSLLANMWATAIANRFGAGGGGNRWTY